MPSHKIYSLYQWLLWLASAPCTVDLLKLVFCLSPIAHSASASLSFLFLKQVQAHSHLRAFALDGHSLWKALLPELHVTSSLLFRSSSSVNFSEIIFLTRNKIALSDCNIISLFHSVSGIYYFVTFICWYVALFHVECKLCQIKDITCPIYHCILRAQKSTWKA